MAKRSKLRFESLQDTVDFIVKTHKHLRSKCGVYCLKLLRNSDGSRIPFEEMNGVKIDEFEVHDSDTIIVKQHSHGTSFRGGILHAFDAKIWLTGLAMINVYDYSTEFWSTKGIDFVYLQQTKEAKTVLLSEWLHGTPKNLRGQWFRDDEAEELLNEIGLGRRVKQTIRIGKHLDLDGEIL